MLAKWPRLKKFLKITFILLLCLFTLLFILFCYFIANPFESDYNSPLASLFAPSWQTMVIVSQPKNLIEQTQNFISWQQLQQHPQWKNFEKTEFCRHMTSEIERIQNQQNEFQRKTGQKPISILDHLIGQEIVFAVQSDQKEPVFVFAGRISFLAKSIYGCIPYIPEQVKQQNKIQWDDTKQIATIALRNQNNKNIYIMRIRDVLLVSNQLQALQQTKQVLNGEVEDILTRIPRLQKAVQQTVPQIVGYWNSEQGTLVTRLTIKPKEIKLFLDGSIVQAPKNFRTDSWLQGGCPATSYSEHLTSYVTCSMPWYELWKSRHETFPSNWNEQISSYTDYLNTRYNHADFIGNWIQTHLENRVLLSIQRTDFDREDIKPYAKYPNFALIIPIKPNNDILSELDNIGNDLLENYLHQNRQEEKIQFWFQDEYVGIHYLRIKFPDFTGGAIRPVISVVGNNLVITSHTRFFKEWCDLYNHGGVAYRNSVQKELHQRQAPFQLFVDGVCLGQILIETNEQLAETLALHQQSSDNFGQRRAEWTRRLKELGLFLQILQPHLSLQLQNESNRIQSEIIIHCGN